MTMEVMFKSPIPKPMMKGPTPAKAGWLSGRISSRNSAPTGMRRAPKRNVAREIAFSGTPFRGQRLMRAVAVLIGRQAGTQAARMKLLAIRVDAQDELVLQFSRRESSVKLSVDIPSRPTRSVERLAGKEVAIGRFKQRRAEVPRPI